MKLLVTLEAASAGCAVVALDLPGVKDSVREFGVLVRPNDVKSLRETLIDLKNENVRRRYMNKGFKVVAKYSWRKVAEDYVKICQDVLSTTWGQVHYGEQYWKKKVICPYFSYEKIKSYNSIIYICC